MFKSLELQLIAQVRKHKNLYDRRFRDFEVKEQLWQQIGNIIGISALTAKRKWTTLKNRYSRLKRSPNPSNDWPFYNYLRFLDDVPPPIQIPIIHSEPRTEILFEPRLEEIPKHIRRSITNSEPAIYKERYSENDEPRVIINEEISSYDESKISNDEACSYELKLSNEDNYTYELKINNTNNYEPNKIGNEQNRSYDLKKIIKGRKTYGKQHKVDNDCETFAQFVAAKLRTLKSDADRDAMKQRILNAINYTPETTDDGILDIVFIE